MNHELRPARLRLRSAFASDYWNHEPQTPETLNQKGRLQPRSALNLTKQRTMLYALAKERVL